MFALCATIAMFSVVQSLFGVGLLVFGTPTLSLLGVPFPVALSVLLPASLAISGLQLLRGQPAEDRFERAFRLWCLLPLGAALSLVLWLDVHISFDLVVASVLMVSAILRLRPAAGRRVQVWMRQHERACLLVIGLVHGVSNLGGGLLSIFASSRHQRKEDVRRLIAYCYAWFAVVQLAMLAVLQPELFGWRQLGYAAVSTTVYLAVGARLFGWVSMPAFDRLLAAFMAAYAALLGFRSAGVI